MKCCYAHLSLKSLAPGPKPPPKTLPGLSAATREATRTAERSGQSAVTLRARHDTVKFGDIRSVDAVTRPATEIDCAVVNIVVNHAHELATRDPAARTAMSAKLAAIGRLSQ